MGRSDWHQNRDWTPQAQATFEAKLRRARDKTQPLVRQADALLIGGGTERVTVATSLLGRYFASAPPHDMQWAPAHVAMAKCHLLFGHPSEAIDELRRAIAAQRRFPGIGTNAWRMVRPPRR